MTNLSDLFPAGAGKQVSFTASGNITSSGKPVILNSDGTVSEVSGTADNVGSISNCFPATIGGVLRAAYDESTDRWVFLALVTVGGVYAPHLTVASLSGTTWTFGTPVSYPLGGGAFEIWDICYDSDNGQIILAGQDSNNSNYLYAVAGTVNAGTGTISWGSSVLAASNTLGAVSCSYDPSTNHVIIAFNNQNNSGYIDVIVGDVSGSTLSFPSSAVSTSLTAGSAFKVVYDPNATKTVLFLKNPSTVMLAKTITLSGNTPSFGANVTVLSSSSLGMGNPEVTFDSSNNTFIVATYGSASSDASKYSNLVNTYTVSGTTGTAGTQTDNGVMAGNINYYACPVYDPDLNRTTALYQGVNNYLWSFTVNITGTSPNFVTSITDGPVVVSGAVSVPAGVNAYDPDQDVAVQGGYMGYSSGGGQVIAYSLGSTNVTATNFLGISDEAISSAASGNITIKGGIASTGLSSLTPASDYYVQDDGTISTVSSSVKAGKALSATALNLEYQS